MPYPPPLHPCPFFGGENCLPPTHFTAERSVSTSVPFAGGLGVRVALATFWLKLLKKLRAVLRHFYFVWGSICSPSFSSFALGSLCLPSFCKGERHQSETGEIYYPKREKESEDRPHRLRKESNRKLQNQKWLLFHTRSSHLSLPPPVTLCFPDVLRATIPQVRGVWRRWAGQRLFPLSPCVVWVVRHLRPFPRPSLPSGEGVYRAPEHHPRSETR